MTERYAHLRPDLFPAADLSTISTDLRPGRSKVARIGHQTGTDTLNASQTSRKHKKMVRAAL